MSFGHEILEDMPKLTMFIMSIPQLVETIEGSFTLAAVNFFIHLVLTT